MTKFNYPASPKADVKELMKISSSYRKHVSNVLLSIFIFILGYLAVFCLSVFLIYFGAILAMGVMSFKGGWLTLVAAVGIMIMVIMFFVFVIKFMFKIKSDEDKNMVEITKNEHPLLFEFIDKVCEETKAPKPNKIVVSASVNASVYYNSSFLSMFFPVRKNLEIGLGLVSSVNLTEFKAIIAHEFGHFSQSSTRLGSYVYRFNRMIHNLLYDNDGWNDALNSITSIHVFLGFFGKITIEMANLVLRFFIQLYKLINIAYLSLSREMEFHADSVAISVTGSKPIISALYRLEFANEAYNYTLNGIINYCKDNTSYPENFFSLLQRNIKVLAKVNNLPVENNLPVISTAIAKKAELEPRIQYKDVWASHPSIVDREKNANRLLIETEIIVNSPWELFSNPIDLQKKLSKHILELDVKNNEVFSNLELTEHFEKLESEGFSNSIYKNFYTYANNTVAIPSDKNKDDVLASGIEDLFNDAILLKLKRHQQNVRDRDLIKSISEGHADIKRFEFDGKKYTRYYSSDIYKQLKQEIEEEDLVMKAHYQKIADWFYVKTEKLDYNLAQSYKLLMVLRKKVLGDSQSLVNIFDKLIYFYNKELNQNRSVDDIPELRKNVLSYYNDYLNLLSDVEDIIVPVALFDVENLSSYKQIVFGKIIVDPSDKENLDGFEPFHDALKVQIQHCAKIDLKLYNEIMKTQEKMLALQTIY